MASKPTSEQIFCNGVPAEAIETSEGWICARCGKSLRVVTTSDEISTIPGSTRERCASDALT